MGRDMAVSADRVLAIVVEDGAAAIDALQALDGIDRRQQFLACLRWADAAGALNTLNDTDCSGVRELPLQRGNVPHHAWPKISPALEAERHARGWGCARSCSFATFTAPGR